MKTKTNLRLLRQSLKIVVILMMVVSQFGWAVGKASADPDPSFEVYMGYYLHETGFIQAYFWPAGSDLTIQVDDPNTPNLDFNRTVTVGDDGQAYIDISNDINIHTDFTVTLSDGAIQKSLTVSLEITDVNTSDHTVSGHALPGSRVYTFACRYPGICVSRTLTADSSGVWQVNFSIPGNGPSETDTLDIIAGDGVRAKQIDNNGNQTFIAWDIPNPHFYVDTNNEYIVALEWPVGSELTITVDDPSTALNPDISRTVTVGADGWTSLDLRGDFDIQVGFTITVSDGSTLKSHTISLEISDVNPSEDTVSGLAESGSIVYIYACSMNCVSRQVMVDPSGLWQVKFSIPGENPSETDTVDIVAGSSGGAYETNKNGDQTYITWNVPATPNPRFEVFIGHYATRTGYIQAFEWPEGSDLVIDIDDPNTATNPDFSRTVTVGTDGQAYIDITGIINIEPGFTVNLSDGSIQKSQMIILEITDIDTSEDTVSGRAIPGIVIGSMICGKGSCVGRTAMPDTSGVWQVDFSVPSDEYPETFDIKGGETFDISQTDENGNDVFISFDVPYPPHFSVNPDSVGAYDWPVGSELTITVDDPGTALNPDISQTITVGTSGQAYIYFSSDIDIRPGFTVTASDGITTKSLTISLGITSINPSEDTVSGVAESGSIVSTYALSGMHMTQRTVTANISGLWKADFSVPGYNPGEMDTLDLVAGSYGGTQQSDDNGNMTNIYWSVPDPRFFLDLTSGRLEVYGWPKNSEITITVDDPGTTPNPDIIRTVTVGHDGWADIYFSKGDIQTGFTVTASDGITTKSLTIKLVILTVNPSNGTVSGLADPDSNIYTFAIYMDVFVNRQVTADASGLWQANFSFPGSGPSETDTMDLVPGTYVAASQTDEYGDQAYVSLTISDDIDGDGVPDNVDNAPINFNPDQRDLDGDGIADVIDPCPAVTTNICNQQASSASAIGVEGGTLTTEEGNVTIQVPSGALQDYISLSITDTGSGYVVSTNQGQVTSVSSAVIGPPGMTFATPITLTFQWKDANNDGIVDATAFNEADLLLSKDGVVIAGPCATDTTCDMVANTFTIQVSSLSTFVIGGLNLPPIADAGQDPTVNEGSTVSLTGAGSSDPDGDELTYHWKKVSSGSGITLSTPDEMNTDATTSENGSYTLRLTVSDGKGGEASDEVVITVKNVAPIVGLITAPIDPVQVNTKINVSATFTDPGTTDTHTAIWEWGDGTTSSGSAITVDENAWVTGSHTYTTPGVYTINLIVKDDDGGSGQSSFQYVVIYDPSAGFVTGGGWINSPAGAYLSKSTLTGKVNLSFEASYKKGGNVPEGKTQFKFKEADLDFRSTSYDWLVVAGSRAQFKGTGTINGTGSYGFMLTATDGTPDRFRIKIWDKATGNIIYDNMTGAADTANPTTALGGGSIVIHK